MSRPTVLVARLDNAGDVLLSGPAVRAVAASADVVYLAGPEGRAAAELLPGVAKVVEFRCPWIHAEPPPLLRDDLRRLERELEGARVDAAAILTSSHQSALPLAMVLRLATSARIAAVSHEYAGSLLDAAVVVTGNTGPMHLAAAVGTPVAAVFAPTVPPERWRPWMVEHRLLGWLDIGCRGCRARHCPLPDQPCLSNVSVAEGCLAVEELLAASAGVAAGSVRVGLNGSAGG